MVKPVRTGVTAGPFEAVNAPLVGGGRRRPGGLVVGRADAAGPVDRLAVTDGSWLTGPGQIVLSSDTVGGGIPGFEVGSRITVDVPGSPSLEVVGIADSVTGTADAWVWPTQTDVLHAEGAATSRQMLYRFASAGSDAAVRAGLDEATAALPDGTLAVPLGYGLHRWIVPIMGDAAGTGLPTSVLDVYRPVVLIGLGAAGAVLAVLGALVPAGWAARTRAVTALRAE